MASTPEGLPADTFAGYELGGIRGAGIGGRVWAARHVESGLEVAVEVIDPPLGADPEFRQRLWTEVHRATVLEHPSIVAVYEAIASGARVGVVTDPLISSGSATLALDDGAVPLAATLFIAEAVLRALVSAHSAGVVHGALAPRVIGVDGARVRVCGFGVGRALHPELPAEPGVDMRAVARLAIDLTDGPHPGSQATLSQQLRMILARAGSAHPERQYRSAAALHSALADAARHHLGPGWRETATAQLNSRVGHASRATPASRDRPEISQRISQQLSRQSPGQRSGPLPTLIRAAHGDLAMRRMSPAHRLRTSFAGVVVVVFALVIGVACGLIASAIRGAGRPAAGSLSVGTRVWVQVEPARGSCNSVFVARARGPVQGSGTLIYRWERSDGEQTANTPVSVTSSDGSFLITHHWQLSGRASNPAITFRLVSPVTMTVTRSLPYSCP